MKVIILGSTGMVGRGTLLECLDDKRVSQVLLINRHKGDITHPKIKEIIHNDFYNFSSISDQLNGYDACFFCLGVSSAGMNEDAYTKITHDLTLNFATTLVSINKEMTFCYISGAGTDSTEKGRMMWARVKGRTENELLALPFKQAFMFRPGYIHPLRGVKSRTPLYNFFYFFFKPFYFILRNFRNVITDTSSVGKAMINAVQNGYHKTIIVNRDINELANQPG